MTEDIVERVAAAMHLAFYTACSEPRGMHDPEAAWDAAARAAIRVVVECAANEVHELKYVDDIFSVEDCRDTAIRRIFALAPEQSP